MTSTELSAAREWNREKTGQVTSLAALPLQTAISYESAPEKEKQDARDRVTALEDARQGARRKAQEDKEAEIREPQAGVRAVAEAFVASMNKAEPVQPLRKALGGVLTRDRAGVEDELRAADRAAGYEAAKGLKLSDEDAQALVMTLTLAGTFRRTMDAANKDPNLSTRSLGLEHSTATVKAYRLSLAASNYTSAQNEETTRKFDERLKDAVDFGQKVVDRVTLSRIQKRQAQERKAKQEDLKAKIFKLFGRKAR